MLYWMALGLLLLWRCPCSKAWVCLFWAECMNFVKTYRTHNATLGYPKIICAGRVHRVPGREQNQKLRAHSWKDIEWNQENMTCSRSDAYLETKKNKYFDWYLHSDSLTLNILNITFYLHMESWKFVLNVVFFHNQLVLSCLLLSSHKSERWRG